MAPELIALAVLAVYGLVVWWGLLRISRAPFPHEEAPFEGTGWHAGVRAPGTLDVPLTSDSDHAGLV